MTMVNSYAPVLISGTTLRTLFIVSCAEYDSQRRVARYILLDGSIAFGNDTFL